MWEIGRTIKSTGSVFSTTRVEISIKEDGAIIKGTDKEHFGYVMLKISFEDSTLATGKKIIKKGEELCSISQEIVTMACGWKISLMDREE